MRIITDHKWKKFKYPFELTQKQLKDLPLTKEELEGEGACVFVYRGVAYHLCDFPRVDPSVKEFKGWHAWSSDTYFSGVLIKVSEDGEEYQVGTYYS